MLIKSKYKVARRVGAPIYEKTQLAKFEARMARRGKKQGKHQKPKSDYGIQLIEKQKIRYTYNLSERQFVKYVRETMEKKNVNITDELYGRLERRLDNIVYRAGFAPTRLAAKQMVAHGHFNVDGHRVTVPSYFISKEQEIAIRPTSAKKPLFADLEVRLKGKVIPNWINLDSEKRTIKINGNPIFNPEEAGFQLKTVFEFYSR